MESCMKSAQFSQLLIKNTKIKKFKLKRRRNLKLLAKTLPLPRKIYPQTTISREKKLRKRRRNIEKASIIGMNSWRKLLKWKNHSAALIYSQLSCLPSLPSVLACLGKNKEENRNYSTPVCSNCQDSHQWSHLQRC